MKALIRIVLVAVTLASGGACTGVAAVDDGSGAVFATVDITLAG